jgi:hypothetical protein
MITNADLEIIVILWTVRISEAAVIITWVVRDGYRRIKRIIRGD